MRYIAVLWFVAGVVLVVFGLNIASHAIGLTIANPQSAVTLLPEVPPSLAIESGGHRAIIRQLIFTADGHDLISVSDDKTIRVWAVSLDGRHAALARTIHGQIGEGREGMIAAAALSPPDAEGRQRWLAVGGLFPGPRDYRNAIRLHDYASGEVQALLLGHSYSVLALAFSPSGRWLASAGKDNTVRLWDLASLQGKRLTESPLVLTGHTDEVHDLAWSPTGDRLAAASSDYTVSLWNTEGIGQNNVSLLASLHGHENPVRTVAFHPRDDILVSGGNDQVIRMWQARNGKAMGRLARVEHKVSALAFSPNGRLLLAGNFSPPKPKRLTLLEYPTGKSQRVFTGHQNLVIATAFHPSGQWVASGGGEHKEILLWDTRTGEILSRLEGKGRTIYAVGFSEDGRYASWGHTSDYKSDNRRGPLEHRFDLIQGARLPDGPPPASTVQALTHVGTFSLSAERGGPYGYNFRLHVQQHGRRLRTIERKAIDGYRHSAYTFTPDAQHILSGGLNGVLRLYTLDGQTRAKLVGHEGEIKAVAVSPDGRWALSGSVDQTLKLWSLIELPKSDDMEVLPTFTLFPATDGEWAAWTPQGFFTASANGSRLIGYCLNQGLDRVATYIPAAQLRERFYRPDLVIPLLRLR